MFNSHQLKERYFIILILRMKHRLREVKWLAKFTIKWWMRIESRLLKPEPWSLCYNRNPCHTSTADLWRLLKIWVWRLSDDQLYLGKSSFAVIEMKQNWSITVYYKPTEHGTGINLTSGIDMRGASVDQGLYINKP